MNKNKVTILGIVILLIVVIGGGFWYANKEQGTVNKEQPKTVKQQKNAEIQNGNQQEEKQENSQKSNVESKKQGEQKVEELEVKDAKNIEPKFGIDDSGLKYNQDGSVDVSEWKISDGLVKFKYPDSWVKFDGLYNTSKPNYPTIPGQVSFETVGFSAPFDVDMFSDKSRDELLIDAVNYAVNSTEKYVKKHNGTCEKKKMNKFNVYMKCEYKKDAKVNILYQRTFIHYNKQSGEKTGGSAGLNIEFGHKKTLEDNRKVVNQILKSAHIEQVIGSEVFVLEDFYLK